MDFALDDLERELNLDGEQFDARGRLSSTPFPFVCVTQNISLISKTHIQLRLLISFQTRRSVSYIA